MYNTCLCHSKTDEVAKKRLKRGVFRSLQELKDAIHRSLDDTNANPKPFTWTKDPNKIIAAVGCLSIHSSTLGCL